MRKFKINGILKLAALVAFIVCAGIVLTNKLNVSELAERRATLKENVDAVAEEVDELKHRYEMPFDKDYITRTARYKLNLVMPGVIIYLNDLNE